MKRQLKHAAATFFFCLMLAALCACSAAVSKESRYYPIRVENPEGLRLFFVTSMIREDNLLVCGNLRRSRLPGPVASTISISVIGSDGHIQAEQSTTYAPRTLSRHRWSDIARFSARFPNLPERIAVIRVR